MRLLVSGARGLVGSALVPALEADGHEVVPLTRSSTSQSVRWDPVAGTIDAVAVACRGSDTTRSGAAALEGFDAVVHLAGESIATGRWTVEKQARIRDSRVIGTRLLAEALAKAVRPPRVFVCASAIGYYGDRGDERLTEESAAGGGFLPEVCQAWEAAAQPASRRGIRVVRLRFGVILSPRGGALKLMLTPFRLGLGGRLGSGRQYLSWIAIDDAIGAIRHALLTDALAGPVNAVSPHPVTNAEFTRTLGRVLRRPTICPVPAFALRLAFGPMADALLLAGARVEPIKLLTTRYAFHSPMLEGALRHLLCPKKA